MGMMQEVDAILASLAESRFRRRFALGRKERAVVNNHGLAMVLEHGRSLLRDRLAPAYPSNDGKQTPMRGHPIFIAQHATATCCRSCLSKWHNLPTGRALRDDELNYVLAVIERWLQQQGVDDEPAQRHLFNNNAS